MSAFIPAVDFGTDIAGVADLDAGFGTVSSNVALSQCLARGFITVKGSLPYAPNWGEDLRLWLNDTMTPARLQALRSAARSQALLDERVVDAAVAASFDSTTGILGLVIQVQATAGPFTLTLAITSVTLALLNSSAV